MSNSISKPQKVSKTSINIIVFLSFFAITNIYGSNLSPTHGPTTGGFTVTISAEIGEFFGSSGTISIGNIPVPSADITGWFNGYIQFNCPAGVGANMQVQANSTNGGTFIPNQLFSYDAPTITAISPDTGPQAGGTTVTLFGTNFGNTTITVLVGTLPGTIAIMPNHISVSFITPAAYGVDIPVKVTVGGQLSNTIFFNYATTGNLGIGAMVPTNILSIGGNTDIMGRLGIGTIFPTAKLHIAGNMRLQDGTQAAGKVLISDATGLATWSAIAETDPQIASTLSNKIPKWNGTTLVDGLITDDGTNIGIGIVPTKKLDIVGAGGLRVSTTNSGSGNVDWIAGSFGASAGNRVVMGNINGAATISTQNSDGNNTTNLALIPYGDFNVGVGIGTLTPANKLTVNGNIDVTGRIGIGTTIPLNKIDVIGMGGIRVSTTNMGSNTIDWIAGNFGASVGNRVILGYISGAATIGAHNNDLSAWVDLVVNPDPNSKVGIGTTSPANKLTVSGNMDVTGNLGVGTNAPIKKLDISGTGGLRVSSTYTGTGSNTDWIAGNFGGIGTLALGDRVVMGNLGARATIGAHNDGLSSWASLAINPGGGNVGIGIAAPENTLDVNGSAGYGIINTTASITLNTSHHTVIIDPTNSAVAITLPGPNIASSRVYIIVNRDDSNHTITGYRPIITTPAEIPSTVIPAGSSITLQSNTNYWYQIR